MRYIIFGLLAAVYIVGTVISALGVREWDHEEMIPMVAQAVDKSPDEVSIIVDLQPRLRDYRTYYVVTDKTTQQRYRVVCTREQYSDYDFLAPLYQWRGNNPFCDRLRIPAAS